MPGNHSAALMAALALVETGTGDRDRPSAYQQLTGEPLPEGNKLDDAARMVVGSELAPVAKYDLLARLSGDGKSDELGPPRIPRSTLEILAQGIVDPGPDSLGRGRKLVEDLRKLAGRFDNVIGRREIRRPVVDAGRLRGPGSAIPGRGSAMDPGRGGGPGGAGDKADDIAAGGQLHPEEFNNGFEDKSEWWRANCETQRKKFGEDWAYVISSEAVTGLTYEELIGSGGILNPMTWPECEELNSFFTRMTPVDGFDPGEIGPSSNWTGVLCEEIDFSLGKEIWTASTELKFECSTINADLPGFRERRLHYSLVKSRDKMITVDHGHIIVNEAGGKWTEVETLKCVGFSNHDLMEFAICPVWNYAQDRMATTCRKA